MGHLEMTNMPMSEKKILAPPPSPGVSIAQAKANFSSLITGVETKQTPVTILRRGVPVAQVIPFPGNPTPLLRGSMAGTGRELGDIVSPLGIEWTVGEDTE